MKSPKNSTINQWIIFYFFGAFIFFIFNLFLIFLQKKEVRFVYLNNHANNLEYSKDYPNALRIWKKLYENNPSQSLYLLRIIQNYLLQENFTSIIATIDKYNININDQDTFLLLLKHGLYSAYQLKQDSLIQKYIQQINGILKIEVFWDTKLNKWIYIDEKFTINKLKKWVESMYSLLEQEISIYTILKDHETSFYYFNATLSFNKKLFLESEVYENLPFNPTSRISPSELTSRIHVNKLGLLWFTLKKSNFSNALWFEELKTEWKKLSPLEILEFLKEAKVIVPISYQNQNYTLNFEYENMPQNIKRLMLEKLKLIKNHQELEKLSGVLLYLQSKITLK
ncbi:MAG: hypothetical protein KatS3mg035_2067 [Bacteroidia bacterium]|nr:MAG: hypothetical protein KatS3mg035_2067 [Bacteroidia bacterium]